MSKTIYNILKNEQETLALLSDSRKLANALLEVKYAIIDVNNENAHYALRSLCHLMSIDRSAWTLLESVLIKSVCAS
jgi:hypothetical protein